MDTVTVKLLRPLTSLTLHLHEKKFEDEYPLSFIGKNPVVYEISVKTIYFPRIINMHICNSFYTYLRCSLLTILFIKVSPEWAKYVALFSEFPVKK